MITVLVLTSITKIFRVNVVLLIAVATLFERDLGGESKRIKRNVSS